MILRDSTHIIKRCLLLGRKAMTNLDSILKKQQVYAPTSNAEEVEVEQFYKDQENLLELTSKKDVLFIIGDWNSKVRVKKYLE